ncbi:Receptor-type tyrosine-protein phosphatase beta [Chionoecetes opilio]|uniref:Receptor-type tyrosine-protein phosphatase beta n=1 Tax=Chionoecetes opilio TaxID=41210 RepID=A0A8J4YPF5_CHIOP|nr:Receptor-type tyrosine-protein phosphatase beta [Chionoecetes opilio]
MLKEYPNTPYSDFINASYIHGYSVAREFIASQGPLRNTVNDFWRMVWEKNVHVIVMVTQCVERNKKHKVRLIRQFHFVAWPDMGCPTTPDTLIHFVKTVRKAVPKESSHVVVHCSAGVGRTGTFIGLSNLMEEMSDQNSIDVFHTVYRMRLHRVNMVQTEV